MFVSECTTHRRFNRTPIQDDSPERQIALLQDVTSSQSDNCFGGLPTFKTNQFVFVDYFVFSFHLVRIRSSESNWKRIVERANFPIEFVLATNFTLLAITFFFGPFARRQRRQFGTRSGSSCNKTRNEWETFTWPAASSVPETGTLRRTRFLKTDSLTRFFLSLWSGGTILFYLFCFYQI